MDATRRIRTMAGSGAGLSLRALVFGLALALAPLLSLIPFGTVQAASGDCATTNGETTCTFAYTGAAQTWIVPDGVTQATFDVRGASGGTLTGYGSGGRGGKTVATLALTPGHQVTLLVGGAGQGRIGCSSGSGGAGGFNGGAAGSSGITTNGQCPGAGGGGASDVRIGGTDLAHRVLVAGGGGGGAAFCNGLLNVCPIGGFGGGLIGGNGSDAKTGGMGGKGGNQDGTTGSGQLGVGSAGANGAAGNGYYGGTGGGGGGYYGGAGGKAVSEGGGGGSGYVNSAALVDGTTPTLNSGVQSGNGQISITFTDSIPPTTTATLTMGTNAAYSPGTWSTQPVTVSLSASDTGGSGVAQTYYAVDTPACTTSDLAACTTYAQPFTITADGSHALTYFSADQAGNAETAHTITQIDIDTTAPAVPAITVNGQPPLASGWYSNSASGVSVSVSSGDATSGIAKLVCTDTVGTTTTTVLDTSDSQTPERGSFSLGDGVHTLRCTATDVVGNASNAATATAQVDLTAPTITASLNPSNPASSGWYNLSTGAPTVSFTCSDATSGIAGSCPSDYTFPDGADQSYTGSVTDNAGNSASTTVSGINVDLTAPSATPSLSGTEGSNGWYVGPVTVTWNWTDSGGSGLDPNSCPATSTYSGPDSTTASISATCADQAGNTTQATSPTFKLDQAAPTIDLITPTDGAVYTLNQSVSASYGCADSMSGIAPNGCTGTVPNGSAVATDTIGSHSFTVTAADVAGHTASQTISYSVGYGIRVLSSQTTPIPRGSVAVLRLEVVDGQGNNISAPDLRVTALNVAPLDQPWNGQNGNFERPFIYSPWLAPGGGYGLIRQTYTLQPGTYVLSFQVAGDPLIHTMQFVVG